ncbi:MAG: metallophosphoesterase [Fibrobacterales bacterium]
MKIAIVSDIHLGAPNCALAVCDDGSCRTASKYQEFKEALGTHNDYLIILGDLFDIAVRDYEKVYEISSFFFHRLHLDSIAKQIIYVPGNHDYSIWHTIEHQINVINRLANNKLPRQFKQSVPGLLDLRNDSTDHSLVLKGLRKDQGETPYGDIYLKNISSLDSPEGPTPTVFNVAYPNLYLATDEGTVLLTHGQYFEPYWNLASEWLPKICKDDATVGDALENISMKEAVAINFPLSQLGSSGFGQAGIFTTVVRQLQEDVTAKDGSLIRSYIANLINSIHLDKSANCFKKAILWFSKKYLIEFIQDKVTTAIKADHTTIYDELLNNDPTTSQRFTTFMNRSEDELSEFLSEENKEEIPNHISKLVFGHTHMPIPMGDPKYHFQSNSGTVAFSNTGGWIYEDTLPGSPFCGAEVIHYESGKGFKNTTVS